MILRIRIIKDRLLKVHNQPYTLAALLNPFQFIEGKSVLNPLDHFRSAFYYLT